MKYSELFSEYALSDELLLKNRIVMAPMTRCFADEDLAPTDAVVNYYGSRSDAGLIITEATLIEARAQGYPRTPGMYSDKQVKAWQKVTDAVHERRGRIFCQLWHTGRMAHSDYTGCRPVAPSPVGMDGVLPRAPELRYEVPRELTRDDIDALRSSYARAASNALEAGFDGVEIHAANGYLIDQFLHQQTNHRVDAYGGSAENRARFALEVVDAVCAVTGAHRTGIRLSPQAYINLDYTEGDEVAFAFLLDALNQRPIAYVHVAAFDANLSYPYLRGRPLDYVRQGYGGSVIACGGYPPEHAEAALADWQTDLVAFGRSFIANPELVEKIKKENQLLPYDESMLGSLAHL